MKSPLQFVIILVTSSILLPVSHGEHLIKTDDVANELVSKETSDTIMMTSSSTSDEWGGDDDVTLERATDIVAATATCIVVIIAIVAMVTCWYRTKSDVGGERGWDEKYPSYGVTGPNQNINYEKSIDGELTRDAELFHYKQTKKRLQLNDIRMTDTNGGIPSPNIDPRLAVAGDVIMCDEETSDGEFTVYECSGFASMTDEPLEIHNPFFHQSNPGGGSIASPSFTSSSDISSTMTSSPSPTGGTTSSILEFSSSLGRKITYK